MSLLLDTCTFLWLAAESSELSTTARERFEEAGNEVFLSAVSAWEIAVKHAMGRLPLPEPPDRFVPRIRAEMGIESLPLDEEATLYLPRLPALHKDPFDRMLVCQAVRNGWVVLTPDPLIHQYPVRTAW